MLVPELTESEGGFRQTGTRIDRFTMVRFAKLLLGSVALWLCGDVETIRHTLVNQCTDFQVVPEKHHL